MSGYVVVVVGWWWWFVAVVRCGVVIDVFLLLLLFAAFALAYNVGAVCGLLCWSELVPKRKPVTGGLVWLEGLVWFVVCGVFLVWAWFCLVVVVVF